MRKAGWAGLALVGGILATWEVTVRLTGTPVYLVPAPTDVAGAIAGGVDGLVRASAVTVGEALAGLAIGTASGLALAVLVVFWRQLEHGVMSLALLIKSTPIIAVAPILTVWMGFGHGPKVVVTALLTFFPVLINALEGFRSVDGAVTDWLRSIDASPRQHFVHARWPSARPFLFAALKVAVPLAMIGAVIAEWIGASAGLGRVMWVAYNNLDMPALFAAVAALTLLSATFYRLVVFVERSTVRWAQ